MFKDFFFLRGSSIGEGERGGKDEYANAKDLFDPSAFVMDFVLRINNLSLIRLDFVIVFSRLGILMLQFYIFWDLETLTER